jgi:light-regulated signal transduction histidine kinase (bacteriophytochrome)
MRSDRILANMRNLIQHDLPNQLVAVQGLLQLLMTDEAVRLSDDGREYVRRMRNATKVASEMVRYLKQMEQLHAYVPRREEICLSTLTRELQGELRRLHPEKRFVFEWDWKEAKIIGDSHTFLSALIQLINSFDSEPGTLCRIRAISERQTNATELAFQVDSFEGPLDGVAVPLPRCWNQHALDLSSGIALGRELLRLSNAELDLVAPMRGPIAFRIMVTKR